ncbi:hypothetical protein [Mycobacterium sherrisii]|uniref:hypothetical protein n=1 Tax=Mycobacterium sherrisii TaxID=243061 RepID=UPI00114F223A|nr:hypothetical protein [Mycobacterium sherrisii]MCV7030253.1 hypothetical protein [Mycobacterium sherrisii]
MSIDEDARVFGQHFEGGWQLGLLVARNVHKRARAGRPAKSERVRNKVTCGEFAKLAGVSDRTIQWYWDTWALAAEAGHCTPADELPLGADDPRLTNIDVDNYEFRELWNKCYREVRQRRSKNGSKESGAKRERRNGSASQREPNEQSSAESESGRTHGNGDQTASDPKRHSLYGLQLAINELHEALKRHSSSAMIVDAAARVATKQHRAALCRVTGAM